MEVQVYTPTCTGEFVTGLSTRAGSLRPIDFASLLNCNRRGSDRFDRLPLSNFRLADHPRAINRVAARVEC